MNYFILNPLPVLLSPSMFNFFLEGICLSLYFYFTENPLMHGDADFLLFGFVCDALKCKAINS